jgi:hypothetical protein
MNIRIALVILDLQGLNSSSFSDQLVQISSFWLRVQRMVHLKFKLVHFGSEFKE